MEEQENVEPVEEQVAVAEPQEAQQEEPRENVVPLTALQKERKKRQEAEERLRFFEHQKQSEQNEEQLYESATKADLGSTKKEIMREIAEETWIQANPDKKQFIDDELTDFLKRKPNLAMAINSSTNRYAEAWELMQAFNPKPKQAEPKPKPPAPGSPHAIPKAAAMKETIDLMKMSDQEYREWRESKRRQR